LYQRETVTLRTWLRRAQSLRSNDLHRIALTDGVLYRMPQQQPAQPSLADGEDRYRELTRMSYKQKRKKLQNEINDPAVSLGLNNFRCVRKPGKSSAVPVFRC